MTFLVSVSCQILNEDSSEYSDQILCVGAVLPKGCVLHLYTVISPWVFFKNSI